MSRSEYTDDLDSWELIRYRGAVKSSIRGKRGQALLKEMAEALDALPEKKLIADELEHKGQYCALGAIGAKRGLDLAQIDPDDPYQVSRAFNIAPALAREIVFENDEAVFYNETPEQRWQRMRRWVEQQLKN